MRFAVIVAVLSALVCFSGCTMPGTEAQNNINNSKNLRVGMTKSEVLKIMGDPLRDEVYCRPDIWYYYIEQIWADGFVTEDECMPLVFKDGKLIGWGRNFLTEQRLKSKDNAGKLILPPAKKGAKKVPAGKK